MFGLGRKNHVKLEKNMQGNVLFKNAQVKLGIKILLVILQVRL